MAKAHQPAEPSSIRDKALVAPKSGSGLCGRLGYGQCAESQCVEPAQHRPLELCGIGPHGDDDGVASADDLRKTRVPPRSFNGGGDTNVDAIKMQPSRTDAPVPNKPFLAKSGLSPRDDAEPAQEGPPFGGVGSTATAEAIGDQAAEQGADELADEVDHSITPIVP
jgi:hypothetical protein